MKDIIAKKGSFTSVDCEMKNKLKDISLIVSWREIANQYFDRSASWLYHKIDGIDGNGGFSPEEKERLKDALYDIASRIRTCAANI